MFNFELILWALSVMVVINVLYYWQICRLRSAEKEVLDTMREIEKCLQQKEKSSSKTKEQICEEVWRTNPEKALEASGIVIEEYPPELFQKAKLYSWKGAFALFWEAKFNESSPLPKTKLRIVK